MKKLYKEEQTRWCQDSSKVVVYELEFKGQLITPGTQFKVKNERIIFTFHCLVTNSEGKVWIEAMTDEGFRSIRPEKISSLYGIKKSIRKKLDNAKA